MSAASDELLHNRLDYRVHQFLDKTVAFAALLSPEGIVKDVSENALSAAGISISEVRGTPFWEGYWFSYDHSLQERMRKAIDLGRDGQTSRFDYVARIRDEGRIDVDFQLAPITDEFGAVVELLASGFDVTERVTARRQLELALREASHRVKNILSMVRSMTRMSKRYSRPERGLQDLIERLDTLSIAHHVLGSDAATDNATFETLAGAVLRPYLELRGASLRIHGDGRLVRRDPGKLLALCLHELASNAVQYGALSASPGTIDILLEEFGSDGGSRFVWREKISDRSARGREGYGLRFVTTTLFQIFDSEPTIEFGENGICIEVSGAAPDLFVDIPRSTRALR